MRLRESLSRWIRFNAVGATGVIVQTVTLFALLRMTGLHYLAATAIAVEASVINNFIWHRKWTWADRRRSSLPALLVRFHLTSGAMSLAGNLILMWVLVGRVGLNATLANAATILVCSLINFALSDRFVFV
ncbi:MAG: GtrA family protein [Acidobacteriota bacterium]